MIRFALIAASTLGFFLTAALGNLMAVSYTHLDVYKRQRLTGPQTPGRPQATFPGSSSGQKRAADAGSYLSFERRLGTWTQKKQHKMCIRDSAGAALFAKGSLIRGAGE